MKNIHVLPTDKPSRLWVNNLRRRYELETEPLIGSYTAKHLYITSDEEIKEGDWVYETDINTINVAGNDYVKNKFDYKVILTTDQALIKDGVQAIDNEFLEWFVKNPSCEFVEVQNQYRVKSGTIQEHKDGLAGYEYYEYKIIIPQEEPKLTFEEYEQQGLEKYSHELKQETLEEAADMDSKNHYKDQSDYWAIGFDSFKRGAEWQAERMYQSMKECWYAACAYSVGSHKEFKQTHPNFKEWFEQFKKKQ
jgi:hypothetical protein